MPTFTISSLREQIQSDLSNAPVRSSYQSGYIAPDGSRVAGGQVVGDLPLVNFSRNSGGNININAGLNPHRTIVTRSFQAGDYGFQIEIFTTAGPNVGGTNPTPENLEATLRLPIPRPLVDTLSIEYEQYEFGPGWGAALQAYQGGQTGTQLAASTGAGAAAALASGATGGPGGLGSSVFQALSGMAVNQFYTILLKGPKFKNYEFEWHLLPQNQTDSLAIRDILNILRSAAAVEQGGYGNVFWLFPQIVRCTFVPQGNGVDTPMYRFKPAVMESVSVDYAPFDSVAFYRGSGGYPESVKLRIRFLEVEFWLQRDFA